LHANFNVEINRDIFSEVALVEPQQYGSSILTKKQTYSYKNE